MERGGWEVGVEQLMKLVVERPRALHHGDVLRDGRQCRPPAVLRVAEALREPERELRDVGAEDRDHPPLEDGSGHVFEVILRWNSTGWREVDFLTEDRCVELLQARARIDPQLFDERAATLLEGIECLRLPARSVERKHQLLTEALP